MPKPIKSRSRPQVRRIEGCIIENVLLRDSSPKGLTAVILIDGKERHEYLLPTKFLTRYQVPIRYGQSFTLVETSVTEKTYEFESKPFQNPARNTKHKLPAHLERQIKKIVKYFTDPKTEAPQDFDSPPKK